MALIAHFIPLALLIVGGIGGSASAETCVGHDSCGVSSAFRTCSCDNDCYKYGTCCHDAKSFAQMSHSSKKYECQRDRTATPVFAQRVCSDAYTGHPDNVLLCTGVVEDKADVINNVLVTSSRTKKTYWNRNCGLCNNEDPKDLRHWSVQVACPSRHGDSKFSHSYVEKQLTFDKDVGDWGLKVADGFVTCLIGFFQPSNVVGKLSYCAPNMVSECPPEFSDEGIVKKCSMYYAERKNNKSGVYYKNVHCALCNGVGEEELECLGRKYSPIAFPKGKEVVKLSFGPGQWLARPILYDMCSTGNIWDPTTQRCRGIPDEILKAMAVVEDTSGAQMASVQISLLVFICVLFFNKSIL